jgi:hypothetical protein
VRLTASDSRSSYNGLQASLRHRRSKGLEFLASYTFSKSMQDNQGFFGAGWGGGSFTHFKTGIGDGNQTAYDLDADYGPSFFDATHNLMLSGNYELPFGNGRAHGSDWSGATQALLGGWNVSAIVSARTGFPITVTNGWNNRSLQPNFAYQRPDQVADARLGAFDWSNTADPSRRWLDAGAFQETELGTFGDAEVGSERGPSFWNVDLGIDKSFDFGGTRMLSLRVEAFNVFNHSNKGMPVRDGSNKQQFGLILNTANSQRILELAAKFYF